MRHYMSDSVWMLKIQLCTSTCIWSLYLMVV